MGKKAPEQKLYAREFQRSPSEPERKPLGPVRALLARQKPAERRIYGAAFHSRER